MSSGSIGSSSPGGSSESSLDEGVTVEDVLALGNLKLLQSNGQIRELQTIIRDR